MTKVVGLTGWAGRDHVADLDFAVGDDDTGDEPFDELPLLFPTDLLEALAHPATELLHAQPEARELDLAVHLRPELALLPSKGLLTLFQVAPPTLVFVQALIGFRGGAGSVMRPDRQ